MGTIVICSGGFDSVTLTYKIHSEGDLEGIIVFDYGQRHKKEIDYAKMTARDLGVEFYLIDISQVGRHLKGSALTDDIEVPDGSYDKSNMQDTIVPNRNAIFLTIAFGVAASRNVDTLAIAVHTGDHFIYPDCRESFINSFQKMQKTALAGIIDTTLLAPFIKMNKVDIAKLALKLKVPVLKTWSCYRGEEEHCGRCGTCIERREALTSALGHDPTVYQT